MIIEDFINGLRGDESISNLFATMKGLEVNASMTIERNFFWVVSDILFYALELKKDRAEFISINDAEKIAGIENIKINIQVLDDNVCIPMFKKFVTKMLESEDYDYILAAAYIMFKYSQAEDYISKALQLTDGLDSNERCSVFDALYNMFLTVRQVNDIMNYRSKASSMTNRVNTVIEQCLKDNDDYGCISKMLNAYASASGTYYSHMKIQCLYNGFVIVSGNQHDDTEVTCLRIPFMLENNLKVMDNCLEMYVDSFSNSIFNIEAAIELDEFKEVYKTIYGETSSKNIVTNNLLLLNQESTDKAVNDLKVDFKNMNSYLGRLEEIESMFILHHKEMMSLLLKIVAGYIADLQSDRHKIQYGMKK